MKKYLKHGLLTLAFATGSLSLPATAQACGEENSPDPAVDTQVMNSMLIEGKSAADIEKQFGMGGCDAVDGIGTTALKYLDTCRPLVANVQDNSKRLTELKTCIMQDAAIEDQEIKNKFAYAVLGLFGLGLAGVYGAGFLAERKEKRDAAKGIVPPPYHDGMG
jgi:hypothetical protein